MEDAAQASLSSPSGSTTTTSAPPSSLSSSSSSLPSVGALGAAAGGATVDAVIQQWKAFNLNGSREQLDKQAAEVVHNQDTSLESRKKLAEATRKFRQLPPETKLKSFGSLLKSYQEEVDRLTQRGSFAEKVFLTLYRSLAEIADPVQALQSALNDTKHAEKLAEQEQENKRLQRQLQEFRKEFQEVQNQEVTIRNLEEKLRNYETKTEELVASRLHNAISQVHEEHHAELESMREREAELTRQLELSRTEAAHIRRAYEDTQAQIFDLKTKHDSEQAAKQAQLDIVVNEVERANANVLALERERDRLKEQLLKGMPGGEAHPVGTSPDIELSIAQKDIEISQLTERLQVAEESHQKTLHAHAEQVASLQTLLERKEEEVKALTTKLESNPTPSEIAELKRELEILKSLDYDLGLGAEETVINEKTVEKLLKEKNRRLETENMKLKASLTDTIQELKRTQEELSAQQKQVAEQTVLIQKLEEDISKHTAKSPSLESAIAPSTPYSSPALGSAIPVASVSSVSSSAPSAEEEFSMVRVVCSQRDRFKARAQELEAECKELQDKFSQVQDQLSSLHNDNVKLYEKIRYLQSYNHLRRDRVRQADVESGSNSEDPFESKYKKAYEENIDPFVLFNKKEKQERYKGLNAAERMTLRTGQFFLANKYSRTFIFFYSVFLHFLVFLTLYKLASTSAVASPPLE
ncbi:hypothetical protein QOT17_011633 [Balamuthia mandrillaris]